MNSLALNMVLCMLHLFSLQIELEDETTRLCDVRPFQPMLKLVEKPKTGDGGIKALEAQITGLIGKRACSFIDIRLENCFWSYLIASKILEF